MDLVNLFLQELSEYDVPCYSLRLRKNCLRVLGLQEEEGSSLEFFRKGYKV